MAYIGLLVSGRMAPDLTVDVVARHVAEKIVGALSEVIVSKGKATIMRLKGPIPARLIYVCNTQELWVIVLKEKMEIRGKSVFEKLKKNLPNQSKGVP